MFIVTKQTFNQTVIIRIGFSSLHSSDSGTIYKLHERQLFKLMFYFCFKNRKLTSTYKNIWWDKSNAMHLHIQFKILFYILSLNTISLNLNSVVCIHYWAKCRYMQCFCYWLMMCLNNNENWIQGGYCQWWIQYRVTFVWLFKSNAFQSKTDNWFVLLLIAASRHFNPYYHVFSMPHILKLHK